VAPEDIQGWRKELGATIKQLAAFSGVSSDTISKIDNGFRRYKPQTLQYISAGLQAFREWKGVS
jgi:transcriptional regulator with XRE-family HTH domain